MMYFWLKSICGGMDVMLDAQDMHLEEINQIDLVLAKGKHKLAGWIMDFDVFLFQQSSSRTSGNQLLEETELTTLPVSSKGK